MDSIPLSCTYTAPNNKIVYGNAFLIFECYTSAQVIITIIYNTNRFL